MNPAVRQFHPLAPFVTGFRDPELAERWWAEAERYEYDERDWDAAECAELAEELEYLEAAIEDDDDFWEKYFEWQEYILEKGILLPLEQSCHDGVLLPTEQRAVRLASCPESLLDPLRWFFEACPMHVKARLALETWVAVRSERARRTGSPEWRPRTGKPRESPTPNHASRFVPRKYSG